MQYLYQLDRHLKNAGLDEKNVEKLQSMGAYKILSTMLMEDEIPQFACAVDLWEAGGKEYSFKGSLVTGTIMLLSDKRIIIVSKSPTSILTGPSTFSIGYTKIDNIYQKTDSSIAIESVSGKYRVSATTKEINRVIEIINSKIY